MTAPRRSRPRVPEHPFEAGEGEAPDWRGLRVCAHCHLLGKPGDAHHPHPAPAPPPLPAALAAQYRAQDAAITGERDPD